MEHVIVIGFIIIVVLALFFAFRSASKRSALIASARDPFDGSLITEPAHLHFRFPSGQKIEVVANRRNVERFQEPANRRQALTHLRNLRHGDSKVLIRQTTKEGEVQNWDLVGPRLFYSLYQEYVEPKTSATSEGPFSGRGGASGGAGASAMWPAEEAGRGTQSGRAAASLMAGVAAGAAGAVVADELRTLEQTPADDDPPDHSTPPVDRETDSSESKGSQTETDADPPDHATPPTDGPEDKTEANKAPADDSQTENTDTGTSDTFDNSTSDNS